MLLRASGEQDGNDYNAAAVTSATADSGVEHDQHLRALTESAIQNQWSMLPGIYAKATSAMGEQAVVDALVVASAFNGITRVADATGIPLDDSTRKATDQLRRETGIDQFAYEVKSRRYSNATD